MSPRARPSTSSRSKGWSSVVRSGRAWAALALIVATAFVGCRIVGTRPQAAHRRRSFGTDCPFDFASLIVVAPPLSAR
jgi:hypothetical protein